jgi:VWFA-related protein
MHLRCSIAIALFAIPSAVFAQTTTPATPQVTIRTQASTVIVDVVVTDKHGDPVTDLTQEKFHILENGKTQQIGFFEAHHGVASTEVKPLPALPENIYSNFPSTPVSDSINVLLMDALNTPLKDQIYVRQQMLAFLKKVPPGTRLAIFTLSSQLRMLQGFSSDPKVLLTALNSKKASSRQSILLPGETDTNLSDTIQANADPNNQALTAEIAQLQQFEADQESFQTDMRVRYTLQAFKELSAYLSGMPGRKNIIWFSGSFPLVIQPDADLNNPFSATRAYDNEIREATNSLAIHQIAVYPVDGRGLMTPPSFSASQSGAKYARNPSAFTKDSMKFFQKTTAENDTMNQIAQSTGGEAIYNSNGIKEAIEHIVHVGSNYYTLAYTPSDNKYDGRYRKISIQVDTQNAKLAYRRGYFAIDPNDPKKNAMAENIGFFRATMFRGAPDATQILFKVRVQAANPPVDLTSEASRNGDNGAKLKGPLVRYQVDWAIDIHNLAFTTTPEGLRHGSVMVSMFGYDVDGQLLNSDTKTLVLNLQPNAYTSSLQRGLSYHSDLDLPKGATFLRLGIFDQSSSRAGATEVPLGQQKAGR